MSYTISISILDHFSCFLRYRTFKLPRRYCVMSSGYELGVSLISVLIFELRPLHSNGDCMRTEYITSAHSVSQVWKPVIRDLDLAQKMVSARSEPGCTFEVFNDRRMRISLLPALVYVFLFCLSNVE
ncbi:hypothetical protein Mapa_007808 [Marchantia paleacea]|nr:hypothetical protein Mapa_007808 [Marchantia paleacea]